MGVGPGETVLQVGPAQTVEVGPTPPSKSATYDRSDPIMR